MHHSFLDRYSDGTSPIHRCDARLKVLIAFILVGCIATLPARSFSPAEHPPLTAAPALAYAALIAILWAIARIPVVHIAKRLALLLPFVLLMSASAAWTSHDHSASFSFVLGISLKALVAAATLSLLAATTPFPAIIAALAWLRMPTIILSLLEFIYRFIYILVDEFERLDIGRQSREFSRTLRMAWRGRAWMLGTFFIRSIERAERVYGAMEARGYTGRRETGFGGTAPAARDVAIALLAASAAIFIRMGA